MTQQQLHTRALRLSYFTVAYNVVEGLVSVAAGLLAGSVALVVMPVLYVAKRRTAERLGSRSLAADSRQTLACMGMSVAVLAGLALDQLFGLWQADPVIGLLIAGLLFREGRETIREGKLCCC